MNTSHHEQKVEEARRLLQKNQSQQTKKEQELQELRSELAELERAWKTSEKQMEKEAAQRGDGVQLEENQVTINVLWTRSLYEDKIIAVENNNHWNKVEWDGILSVEVVLNQW